MTMLDKTKLRELTPARLWADLDPETREAAARTIYSDALDDDTSRLEADTAIATTLRFRPVAVRKLPTDKRVGYLLRAVRVDDSLASTLLLALHLGRRRAMLGTFLDQLGIEHETVDRAVGPTLELECPIVAAGKDLTEDGLYTVTPLGSSTPSLPAA